MSVTNERWLPVLGYEGLYEVSDLGRVRSCEREHVTRNRWGPIVRKLRSELKSQTADKDGYSTVRLYASGQGATLRVSRIVLCAFDRHPNFAEEACHSNHDLTDNRLSNLRWGTRQTNEDEKTQAGRRPQSTVDKLTASDADSIRALWRTGYYTQKQIAEKFGCTHSNVSCIVRGVTW